MDQTYQATSTICTKSNQQKPNLLNKINKAKSTIGNLPQEIYQIKYNDTNLEEG